VQNVENGVVSGGYGSLEVIDNVTIRQSAYDFLFDFNRNCASVSYHFRDIASYLSKIANFNAPNLYLAPLEGGYPGRISWRSLASEN